VITFDTIASSSDGCCYAISGGGADKPIMLDCGIPLAVIRKALNYPLSCLAGCCISHAHGDHTKAAKALTADGVHIYASAETLAAVGSDRPYMMHPLVVDGKWRAVGEWQVLSFETTHDCDGSLGFVVRSPDGDDLLYITDTVYSRYAFRGLTHIAIEANHSEALLRANVEAGIIDPARYARTARTHMSIERAITLLKACDLSKVREITLLHLSDANSDEALFKTMVQEATGIPCAVAPKRKGLST
jgi:phosphoribosyl 1,2-cyclic phosphodiesterase